MAEGPQFSRSLRSHEISTNSTDIAGIMQLFDRGKKRTYHGTLHWRRASLVFRTGCRSVWLCRGVSGEVKRGSVHSI